MPTTLPKDLHIARGNSFKVNADSLIIDHSKNGRWKPVSEEKIRRLADNIIRHKQVEPILIRCIEGKGENAKYALVVGYTRTAAIKLINSDPELRTAAGLGPNDTYPIECLTVRIDEDTAFITNVIENAHRNATTPMDDATNHEKFRTLGYSERDISDITGLALPRISLLKNLLLLESKFQDMVHEGTMSVDAAVRLIDIPAEKRDEVVFVDDEETDIEEEEIAEESTSLSSPETIDSLPSPEVKTEVKEEKPKKKAVKKKETPKRVKSAALTQRVRDAQRETGVIVGRTPKELKSAMEGFLLEEAEYGDKKETEAIKHGLKAVLGFITGELEDGEFLDKFSDSVIRFTRG